MTEVIATYQVYGSPNSFDKKAEGIALGLTIGSWTDLPLLEQTQLKKHKGQTISIQQFENELHPTNKSHIRAEIKIAFPSANFSPDIPAILTTIFGKLSLDGEIKLLDVQLSTELQSKFPGPQFGISKIRDMLGITNRPLLMSIFKGVIGRDEEFFTNQLKAQALGGVDLVKDDEILFENELLPFKRRIIIGRQVLDQTFQQTGHRTLYAANLSGRTGNLIDQALYAKENGADALLFNVHTYGLDVMQELVEHKDIQLPIMAHPAFSGSFISSPNYGVASSTMLGTLTRLAGADFSLFPSPYGSVALEKQQALNIATQCTNENGLLKTFPVPSAGIHPSLVPQLIQDFGIDSIINAGGGVHGHPDGAISGGLAFRHAIDGVLQGQSLEQIATESEPLAKAIGIWGK